MVLLKDKFTLEQKMLHYLMLHSCDVALPGLFHGKLGIALVLAEYAKYYKMKPIKKLSDALIEEALDNLCDQMTLGLASGLCGMGWGVEYLLQGGYMKG